MRIRNRLLLAMALSLVGVGTSRAWFGPGHQVATRLAVASLRGKLPECFVRGAGTVAHCSVDPDLFRLRSQPELRDQQRPEHFIDLELLKGAELPGTRSGFADLCRRRGLKPSEVGTVPYAVVEWTQRLTVALAELRKWPGNPHVRAKALVYAGHLAHYAQDLCMPLHTTIHYDGRAGKDGRSPRSGIHAKVDALIQKVARGRVPKAEVAPLAALMPGVVRELAQSHALVDTVYRIEPGLPDRAAPLKPDTAAARFAEERLRACVRFTATLYLTAWHNAVKLPLPAWHQRAPH